MTTIAVDCAEDLGELDHFWRSTGFTPATLLLDRRMEQTLTYVGAVANQGIEFVRIHFMLDLVTAKGLGTDHVAYHWSDLDRGIDLLQRNGLKVFFELMGNPSSWFSDFNDPGQLAAWQQMVTDLAEHLIERYGKEEIESWWFECWNEPDIGWWPQFKEKDWGALGNYFSACVAGLHAADPQLRIGGPGSAHRMSEGYKAFVAHCDAAKLDIAFTSTHCKGGNAGNDFPDPDLGQMFDRKREEIEHLRAHHPRLAELKVIDNECDPMVSWRSNQPWRPRPYYAAITSRVLDGHLRLCRDRDGIDFAFLSNDNGFMGPWGFRSQLATIGSDQQLAVDEFELIKKPVLGVMSLWSLLGDRRVGSDLPKGELPELGALATTRGDDQVAVLLYHSRDDFMSSGEGKVSLKLANLPADDYTLVHYHYGPRVSYPHQVWMAQGHPRSPDADQLAAMREVQEPTLVVEPGEVAAKGGSLEIEIDLPLHSVSLLLFTRQPAAAPGAVTGLRAEYYKGITQRQQVMLAWHHVGSRNLRTYEVEFAPAGGDFAPVEMPDQLDACFLHVREARAPGRYRVRAMDYWGRAGEWSAEVEA